MGYGTTRWRLALVFCQVVLRVMFAAPGFLPALIRTPDKSGHSLFILLSACSKPLLKKCGGGMLQNALVSSNTTDPELQKIIELMASQSDLALNLPNTFWCSAISAFMCSVFWCFLVYRIVAREKESFSLVFQIMAYGAAPSLLCVVPAIGSIVGTFWGIACLAVGCKAAMNLDWARTFAGIFAACFRFAPILLQTLTLLQSATWKHAWLRLSFYCHNHDFGTFLAYKYQYRKNGISLESDMKSIRITAKSRRRVLMSWNHMDFLPLMLLGGLGCARSPDNSYHSHIIDRRHRSISGSRWIIFVRRQPPASYVSASAPLDHQTVWNVLFHCAWCNNWAITLTFSDLLSGRFGRSGWDGALSGYWNLRQMPDHLR